MSKPMSRDELSLEADKKWQAFYRAATASGVWFIAFIASIALAKWSNGAGLSEVLLVLSSFVFAVVTGLLMVAAMLSAQTANRKSSAAAKADDDNIANATTKSDRKKNEP